MPTVNESVDIAAAPEQVWEKIARLENYAKWMATHVSFSDGHPDALSVDDTFKEKVKIMGMPGEVSWTVVDAKSPKRLELDGKGPMGTKMHSIMELEEADGGTRLNAANEFGGAALGPMSAALEKESKKALTESLDKLKSLF